MKILFFESYPGYSGAQIIVSSIAEGLEKKGFDIQYLMSDNINGDAINIYKQKVQKVEALNAPSVLLQYGDEKRWFKLKNIFKILFFGLIPYNLKLIKYLIRKDIDIVFCADIRGLLMVMIPSNAVAETIEFKKNVEVIYNGISINDDSITTEKLEYTKLEIENHFSETLFDDDKINLLTITSFYPQKGLHHILEALSEIFKENKILKNKIRLIIVGDCKKTECKEYKNYILNYIDKHKLNENIYFAGWQSNVFPWIKNSDLFIFASVDKETFIMNNKSYNIESSEGLPTVLIESTMLGVWTIATNVTGVDEIINSENGLIIEPSSAIQLKNAILNYQKNNYKVTNRNDKFKIQNMLNKFYALFTKLNLKEKLPKDSKNDFIKL